VRWLGRCPSRVSSAAKRRTLLQVHRSGDCGSPRVVGSISFSKSATNVGSWSIVRLRPPPGRRTRPGASAAAPRALSSLAPARMARRETPVARATADTPPAPAAATSAAATSRRRRSSRCRSISRNRRRIAASATIHGIRYQRRSHNLVHLFRDDPLVDGLGTVQTTYTYDAFGATTVTGMSTTNSQNYTGRETDGTGLHY